MIYLDHAATTPLDPRVHAAMEPFLNEYFGNASSLHAIGQRARRALDEARETVSEILKCEAREIIFTSGGTESDNLALRGVLRREKTGHLITTAIEHSAILKTADDLAIDGYAITKLPVDADGRITTTQIENALTHETRLVSVMLANNEIGTIQPIRDIGKMLRKRGEKGDSTALLHTDAVQAAGAVELDVRKLKCDLLSLSAHKIYGPKGVGALYVRAGIELRPQLTGGGHEHRLRSGTENVAGIVGFATALKLAEDMRERETTRLTELREYFIMRVLREIPDTRLNGHATDRLPGNANIGFRHIAGESLLLRLDFAGIAVSAGSACSSGTLEPSHVLTAIGLGDDYSRSSIRCTLGRETTKDALDHVIEELKKIIADLRATSPF